MAKVTGPLMSVGASGTIAQTLTFGMWKQTNWCRFWTLTIQNATASQQVIQSYFAEAVSAWQGETSPHKALWTAYATAHSLNMSGFDLYVKAYMKFIIASTGTPPTGTITPPNMT